MEDKQTLTQIHESLLRIRERLQPRVKAKMLNRTLAVKQAYFIKETVNEIAPGRIKAHWHGSFEDHSAPNFPKVTLKVKECSTDTVIAEWVLDGSGEEAPEELCKQQILETIASNLQKLEETLLIVH